MTPDKTFEEQLDEISQKATELKEFLPLDQIPKEIKLKWVSEEFKEDTQKNRCLYVVFETEDNHKIKQKYTTLMVGELKDSITMIGTKADLEKSFHLYVKKAVGKKGSFERLYPVPQERSKKK